MVKGLSPVNIRVSRVSSGIEGAYPIAIERVTRKSGIWITGGVRSHLSDLHKVSAIVALTALDLKAALIV